MTVLATQNLLILMCTTTYQNLGGIGVTLNESNGPESNGPSTGVTLTKFVCGLNPMRTRWIRHFWIGGTGPQPRPHSLDERHDQPSIPNHQLAHFAWQISVDDLHVRLVLLALVVLRHEHDHAILDEQIPKPTLHGVAVPHA